MTNRPLPVGLTLKLRRRLRVIAATMALLAVAALMLQPAAAIAMVMTPAPAPHHAALSLGAAADHDCETPAAVTPAAERHGPLHVGACLSICCLALIPAAEAAMAGHSPAAIQRRPPIANRLIGETPSLDPPPPRAA